MVDSDEEQWRERVQVKRKDEAILRSRASGLRWSSTASLAKQGSTAVTGRRKRRRLQLCV
jgi:hypothetical protein